MLQGDPVRQANRHGIGIQRVRSPHQAAPHSKAPLAIQLFTRVQIALGDRNDIADLVFTLKNVTLDNASWMCVERVLRS